MGILSVQKLVKSAVAFMLGASLVFVGADWWQLRSAKTRLKNRLQEIGRRTVAMNDSQRLAEDAIRNIEGSSKNLVSWALKDRQLEKLLKIHDDDILGEDNIADNEYAGVDFDLLPENIDQNVHATLEAMAGAENRQQRTLSNLQSINQTLKAGLKVASAIPTIFPVKGWISSGYGYRKSPFHGKRTRHHGVDVAAARGSAVHTTADGIIEFVGRKGGYGNLIVVSHGFGIKTRYGHNGKIVVKKGQQVAKGQLISYVGMSGRTTGPHVHYEILIYNKRVNPFRFMKTPPRQNLAAGSHGKVASTVDEVASDGNLPMGGDTGGRQIQEITGNPSIGFSVSRGLSPYATFYAGVKYAKVVLKGKFSSISRIVAIFFLGILGLAGLSLSFKLGPVCFKLFDWIVARNLARDYARSDKGDSSSSRSGAERDTSSESSATSLDSRVVSYWPASEEPEVDQSAAEDFCQKVS